MSGPDPVEVSALADAVIELGADAMAFGRIDRTCCYHATGEKESDADHTVMLAWVAPALPDLLYPGELDPLLVGAFADVHDAVELLAGDTPTLRITAAGQQAKAQREAQAQAGIEAKYGARLPYFPRMVERYERQEEPEARFVRAVDKGMPKLVHFEDGARGLAEEGIGSAELTRIYQHQDQAISRYAGEFTKLTDLHRELANRVVAMVAGKEAAAASAAAPLPAAETTTEPGTGPIPWQCATPVAAGLEAG